MYNFLTKSIKQAINIYIQSCRFQKHDKFLNWALDNCRLVSELPFCLCHSHVDRSHNSVAVRMRAYNTSECPLVARKALISQKNHVVNFHRSSLLGPFLSCLQLHDVFFSPSAPKYACQVLNLFPFSDRVGSIFVE